VKEFLKFTYAQKSRTSISFRHFRLSCSRRLLVVLDEMRQHQRRLTHMQSKQEAVAASAEVISRAVATKSTAPRSGQVLVAEGIAAGASSPAPVAAPVVASPNAIVVEAAVSSNPVTALFGDDDEEDDLPPVAAGSKRKKGKGKKVVRSKAIIGSETEDDVAASKRGRLVVDVDVEMVEPAPKSKKQEKVAVVSLPCFGEVLCL
jgi:hypothetical protein